MDDTFLKPLVMMAKALESQGKMEAAVGTCKLVLEMEPGCEEALRFLQKINKEQDASHLEFQRELGIEEARLQFQQGLAR